MDAEKEEQDVRVETTETNDPLMSLKRHRTCDPKLLIQNLEHQSNANDSEDDSAMGVKKRVSFSHVVDLVRITSKFTKKDKTDYNSRNWIPTIRSNELKQEANEFIRITADPTHLPSLSPFLAEHQYAAQTLQKLVELRDKYMDMKHEDYSKLKDLIVYKGNSLEPRIIFDKKKIVPPETFTKAAYSMKNGVITPTIDDLPICSLRTVEEFSKDYFYVLRMMSDKKLKSFTFARLQALEKRFDLHKIYNDERELTETKRTSHRDFYNVRKVDTHIHHSACMHPKHLLMFVKDKIANEPDVEVHKEIKTGKVVTLKEMLSHLNIKAEEINVDLMDVQASNTFQRFDRFNKKYSPLGQDSLRTVFLKYDNYMNGRYIAELTRSVLDRLEINKYEFAEWRVSIYGRSKNEWSILSKWIYDHNLISHQVRWMIQTPRLYSILKAKGDVNDFQQFLNNIFEPLFEVTVNPSKNPDLFNFLLGLAGFDSVDDESAYEDIGDLGTSPEDWTSDENPPYAYWCYYFYANIYTLNALRKKQGLNTFQFRPHCGEAGSPDHLVAAYLVADSINHGIMLGKSIVLQYLYYLKQIGLAMSPVSNNRLFLEYSKQPFKKFFDRGLNVSLSTDDPLLFHTTKEPLLEEYSIASQIWNLSTPDLCEIARNSVMQSGFERIVKLHWIGDHTKQGKDANEILKTNLPYSRFLYRIETLDGEYQYIKDIAELDIDSALL